jgi:hypothetical protein
VQLPGGCHTHAPACHRSVNNPYALEPPPVAGTRPTLDSGQLGIVAIGGKEVLERKAKQTLRPKSTPQPSH